MADIPTNFWQELKRRKVIRVITVYAAAAFVILELVDIVSPALGLPSWTLGFMIVLLGVGFIISTILSWIFDITPEGIQKTKPSSQVSNKVKQPASLGWKISTYTSVLIIIAFVVFYFVSNVKQSSDISKLEKTLAVLPFENWSYEEEYSHYGDAISNEITTELFKIEEFHVVSFTSSSQYKPGNKPPIPQIARELGVNFIIEGSIERQGDQVNIHVQVIQADKDDHIWAKVYEGDWNDIHTIRANITKAVASELKTVLTPEEIKQIERKRTDNQEAYEYYLRGNDFYSRSYAERDWSLALKNYQKAVELDPDFALAYTKIAISHMSMYWWGHDHSKDRRNKCKKAIDAAFKLDPNIPEGYIAVGLYYYWGFMDYNRALEKLDSALLYMPNNNECIYYKAAIYRRMGNWDKSLELMKKSFRNDPNSFRKAFNIGSTYYNRGEYAKALEYFDKSINLKSDFAPPYEFKTRLFIKWEGHTDKAAETLEAAELSTNFFDYSYLELWKLNLYIYDGHFDEAIALLNTSKSEAFEQQTFYYPKPLLNGKIFSLKGVEQADHYYDQARIFLEDKINENTNDPRYYSSLGICYAGLGQKDKAIDAGIRAVELWPMNKDPLRGPQMLKELAVIYVMVGEYDLALEQLDCLLANPGELSANILQLDPAWKPLWDLPEFKKLIEKYSDN